MPASWTTTTAPSRWRARSSPSRATPASPGFTCVMGNPCKQEYRDLWVVTLDEDGLCTAFEEWPFWPEGTPGTSAGSDPR